MKFEKYLSSDVGRRKIKFMLFTSCTQIRMIDVNNLRAFKGVYDQEGKPPAAFLNEDFW